VSVDECEQARVFSAAQGKDFSVEKYAEFPLGLRDFLRLIQALFFVTQGDDSKL